MEFCQCLLHHNPWYEKAIINAPQRSGPVLEQQNDGPVCSVSQWFKKCSRANVNLQQLEAQLANVHPRNVHLAPDRVVHAVQEETQGPPDQCQQSQMCLCCISAVLHESSCWCPRHPSGSSPPPLCPDVDSRIGSNPLSWVKHIGDPFLAWTAFFS